LGSVAKSAQQRDAAARPRRFIELGTRLSRRGPGLWAFEEIAFEEVDASAVS